MGWVWAQPSLQQLPLPWPWQQPLPLFFSLQWLVPSAQAGILGVKGKGGMSVLCRACERGHSGLVERLLAQDV